MTSTYNLRAVSVVRRALSRRRSAWTWVPPVAWLLLLDSLILSSLALLCLVQMDPKSRVFPSQVHTLDVVVGAAGLCICGALFSSARAAWRRTRSGGAA